VHVHDRREDDGKVVEMATPFSRSASEHIVRERTCACASVLLIEFTPRARSQRRTARSHARIGDGGIDALSTLKKASS
jgi:hypothetical protein